MVESVSIVGVVLAVALGGGVMLLWQHVSWGRRGTSKSGARLPKGSFGWPIFGESVAYIQGPFTYASSRVKRYGNIFKSYILLKPTILGTTPDFAKFVISNHNNVFASGYPRAMADVLGPKALIFQNGSRHRSIKKILQKHLLPDSLRTQVGTLESIVLDNMASWERRGTILGREGARKITRDTGIWLLLGMRDIGSTPEGKKVLEDLESLSLAALSMPVNLPGTSYNKGLKAKATLTRYFKQLIEKRKGQENSQDDVLGDLLAAQKDPQAREEVGDIGDDMIADNLIFLWVAAYETTSITLTWVLKLLNDHPDILNRIQAEQQEIAQSKDPSAEPAPRLSWEDTRKMVYTQKFFQEVQRYISIAPSVMRKTTQDVEYDGHLIPKDWSVYSVNNFIHFDPEIYPDPDLFNPNRFDAQPKPYTYLPFSSGPHICSGMDLAKLITLIFIRHVTTTYICERAGPDQGVEFVITAKVPKGGYPINTRRRN